MRDPYEVLGVDRKASAGDIKSAYRRLAKKLHPDANKNDPKAATRFSELNAAHELLGDEDKRKAFDRGEIDAEGKPRFQGFEGFGGGGPRPGGGAGRRLRSRREFRKLQLRSGGVYPRDPARRARAAAAAASAVSRTFSRKLSAARPRRAAGAGSTFEPEDFGVGADVHAALTVTLPEAARGVDRAVAAADRQGCRCQNSRRHHQRPADQAQGPGHGRAGAAPATC